MLNKLSSIVYNFFWGGNLTMPGVSTKQGNSAMIWGIDTVPFELIHCALWMAASHMYWTTWDWGQMLFVSHSLIWMARSPVIGDSAICDKLVNSKDLQDRHNFKVWNLSETSLVCCKLDNVSHFTFTTDKRTWPLSVLGTMIWVSLCGTSAEFFCLPHRSLFHTLRRRSSKNPVAGLWFLPGVNHASLRLKVRKTSIKIAYGNKRTSNKKEMKIEWQLHVVLQKILNKHCLSWDREGEVNIFWWIVSSLVRNCFI